MKLWYVYLENIFLEEKWMRPLGNSGGLQHSEVCVCLVLPGQLKGPEDAVDCQPSGSGGQAQGGGYSLC